MRGAAWDPETGIFTRVEGPDAFTTWGEAEEASRFLGQRIARPVGRRGATSYLT